ncbi:hypothetical protein Clacol_009446 [Clathrus columnatus]|uniref:DUF6699 domain-containing protein n=1 Tax=Clathrus columnatus TaxID=1419009 RepID=A0AAV5AS50_9AGAM|nr:hypothetical protein Clacol_009446 [Clathrus columnatus]
MNSPPPSPHTPRIKTIPLPVFSSPPERQYRDGQLTPVTPHPLAQQHIQEILQPITNPEDLEEEATSHLYYDFKDHPSRIVFKGKNCTATILLMPATTIPIKQLRILLPTTPPMSVIVTNSHFVSVMDILETIYFTLHAPVSPSIGDDLDLPLESNSSLLMAPSLPPRGNSYAYHPIDKFISEAPRRKIDYLGGRTVFGGLTRCSAGEFGPITWKLHTT